jgi:crotonobetaine/carnitine-CoA ligase
MIASSLENYDPRFATLDALISDRAARGPGRPFVSYLPEGRTLSYGEFDAQTRRLSRGLDACGLPPGAHVAVIFENCLEQLLATFGINRGGRVTVPINAGARGDLLQYFLSFADCSAVIVEARLYARVAELREHLPKLQYIFVADVASRPETQPTWTDSVRPFRSLLDVSLADTPGTTPRFSDLAMLMFTSGTTGPSKAIMFPHSHIVYWGLEVAHHHEYVPEDIAYVFMPLFHGNALLGSTMASLAAGSSIALTHRFSVSRFWDDVRDSGATVTNAIGSVVDFLWSQPPEESDRQHRLRRFHSVPVPRYGADFEARFGLAFMSAFGLTDYCLGTSFNTRHPRTKLGSAGTVRNNIELRVVDEEDIELPPGSPGEIVLRNRIPWAASSGYYKAAEQTLSSRRNLWFHTGDRGYLDADGYLWFSDRIKDSIRRRGENISAFEVEEAVRSHPAVQDVAVYAIRAESSEDEVAMSVVLRAGSSCDEETLVRHCSANLAYFMVPRFVEIVPELPMTLSMKVEKYKLRKQAEAEPHRLWDRAGSAFQPSR